MSVDLSVAIMMVVVLSTVLVYSGARIEKEQKYTAAHELGHALACKYYGVSVGRVVINQFGTGGYTTFDVPHSTKQHLVIIAAGYVAEETAKGNPVTTAFRGGQYEGDAHIARALVGDDPEAVALAIRRAEAILATQRVATCMKQTIPVLISEREIRGERIKL